jgi:segregation and condensation protein A
MGKLSYKLDSFEGPLDLLLFLISKNKLNIYEVRISDLVDQYMEQIQRMQQEEMEIASEFLEMAARLVQIKSMSLLPKHEEADELSRELTGQLIEYQQMKEAAQRLGEQICFDRFVRAPAEMNFEYHYTHTHTLLELYNAYISAVGKGKKIREAPSEESFSGIVSKGEYVSVTSRIVHLLRRLRCGLALRYESLFQSDTRSGMVATFLALLELVHGRRVSVEGTGKNIKIRLIGGGGRVGNQRDHRGD